MAKYRKRSDWEQLVAQYRSSGLSQREFAKRRGVSESSLSRWSRRLLAEEGRQPGELAPVGLVEIVSKEDGDGAELAFEGRLPARIRVGSSVCLELPEWPSPQYVALVARAYEAVRRC